MQRARQRHVSMRALSRAVGMDYGTMSRRFRSHGWKMHEIAAVGQVLGFNLPEIAGAAERAAAGHLGAPMD